METLDYSKIGLKVGIEIHRQINTKKLFCSCPSNLVEAVPDYKVKRYLHAVSSELREKDEVAEFEQSKGRYAVYECYDNNNCLIELDEEPPKPINKESLDAVLQIALLTKAEIVNEIEVMRKQILDYSNTSGFQRTALVALNGKIKVKGKEYGISNICIEEDAARKIKEDKDKIVFRLDRLGIPLIEISTKADINSPEEAKEVAAYLGMLLKSTGKFKSGLGTIRQDVNLSIKDGARIEIKGVQDLKSIPKVIEKEALRQLDLIKKWKKVEAGVRKANEDFSSSYLRPLPGAARMYPETDIPYIKINKKELKKIKLPKLITEKVVDLEKKYKLSKEIAKELIDVDFKAYVKKFNKLEPKLIAQVLIEVPKDIKKRYNLDISKLKQDNFEFVLATLDKNKISKGAVPEIFVELIKGKKIDLRKYKIVSRKELEREIKKIVKENKDAPIKALMGVIMGKYKGKVEGKEVIRLLKKMVK